MTKTQTNITNMLRKAGRKVAVVDETEALCRLKSQVKNLEIALEESVKLQSFYGQLLNAYDGGQRLKFDSKEDWMLRLQQTGDLP